MLVTTKHYTSIGRYGSVWNNTLEQIIRNSDPRDRFNFLALNKERKGLGASGYGSILFSDLFDVSIPLNAALINSSLVYLCGIIDDDIDRPEVEESEAVEILNDFEDFLETGNGFSNLQPFRDFIIERYPQDDWKNLIGRLSDHKEAVIEEVMASSLEELKAARIRIGETYGHLVATIISAFAERNLTEQEREVLEAYSAGCTLMDDVADFFQDRRLKQKNPIEEGIKSGNETIRSLMDGWNEATIFFERGSESVKNKQRSDYNSIVTLTKLFYGSSLVKKFVASMLDSFLFTQYRAGLNNEPFKIFKLRTMREDNEISEPNSMSNGTKTVPDYQRVTKVGRFLRKYWIDELPQLVNVLKGEMSIIGPRAMAYDHVASFPDDILKMRGRYKPGVADAALPLMTYKGLDRNEAERTYLKEREQSTLPNFYNLRCLGTLLLGMASGKIRGI